ncbi:MAG TPA: methyltransferase domain-containing protein [Bacteroidia bacterium]|nr:methyltransferase domain-containing protein [Bacteroidia bacterium]
MIDYVAPVSKQPLKLTEQKYCTVAGESFPVINEIPRFVELDNYANAFGLQWKSFAKIQLDSYNGSTISKDRLIRCLGMPLSEVKGKAILEVGSGAGRFTEHLVKAEAMVHSVDLSVAVEVNKENIGRCPNYQIAQADVYRLPYPENTFDIVLCLGVIQHTPSPEKTMQALWKMVKPGGLLVIDHYTFDWMYFIKPIMFYRFFLKRMNPKKAKNAVEKLVAFFFPLHWKYRTNKLMTLLLNRISPCYVYINTFGNMGYDFHFHLTRLDTYDGLTDYYKHLRSKQQIENILNSLNPLKVDVWHGGNGVEARAIKQS